MIRKDKGPLPELIRDGPLPHSPTKRPVLRLLPRRLPLPYTFQPLVYW